jgi:hypothetical protein
MSTSYLSSQLLSNLGNGTSPIHVRAKGDDCQRSHTDPVATKESTNMQYLYEYTVLHHPAHTSENPHPKSSIIVPTTQVLAGNHREVAVLAHRAIPEEHAAHIGEVEVIVRMIRSDVSDR